MQKWENFYPIEVSWGWCGELERDREAFGFWVNLEAENRQHNMQKRIHRETHRFPRFAKSTNALFIAKWNDTTASFSDESGGELERASSNTFTKNRNKLQIISGISR